MVICGRTLLAAIMASAVLLLYPADSFPSANTEAGHKLTVARERLADLKRSPKKKKYRSYWMDCIRTFELVEKKYPSSPAAADACFERAAVYLDLYQQNRWSRDVNEASRSFAKCQTTFPRHERAPEALYRSMVIARDQKKDSAAAMDAYRKLSDVYPDSAWTEKARARMGINAVVVRNGKKKKKEAEIGNVPEAVIAAPKGPPGTVMNVRYWSGGNYTRIVIDLDKSRKFQARELRNPDRLVFDILNSRVSDSVNKDPLPVNDGILKQVRTNQYAPNTVRVVLDLASIESYKAFPLPEPERLVIDVTGRPADGEQGEDNPAAEPAENAAEPETQAAVEKPVEPEAHTPFEPLPAPPKTGRGAKGDPKLSLSRQL